MSQKIITFCFLSLFCLIGTYTIAQNIQVETKVKNEILQNPLKFGLSVEDASQIVMVTSYTDQKRGISYCYALQTYDDIPIYNALTSFYVGKNGQVGAVKSNFINTHSFQIKGNRASAMSVEDAVKSAAVACGVVNPQPQLLESRGDKLVLAGGNISEEKIEPHYTWYVEQGNLVLGYEMQIKIIGEMDHYKIVVNSQDGRIMNKLNYKLSCKFDGPNQFANHTHDQECRESVHSVIIPSKEMPTPPPVAEASKYRVYELPLEAPSFGSSTIAVSPYDPEASPYGWHDLDGQDGVDNTTLQGNNAYAFNDNDGNYQADSEVDGGQELVFDKVFDQSLEPQESKEAAAVNLFYMVNKMHDFSYHFGFDEQSGNFQLNNYGKGGQGLDFVKAMSQYGNGSADYKNNADFSTPEDGKSGQMRMFLWDNGTQKFNILEPSNIAGGYEVGDPDFGSAITTDKIEAEVVLALDKTGGNSYFCGEAKNADQMQGKIVAIDRGSCDFSQKVYNAQKAGAVAAIIMNFEDQVIGMASGTNGTSVTIPSVFVNKAVRDKIKGALATGEKVVVKLQLPDNSGPALLDASYDNGVIAHEYGHGISIRLTGGPQNSGCLSSAEQMGEGWSDFMSLVTSKRPGDKGTDARGIGTYVQAQPTSGSGIRRFPYSTDMSKCPNTFADVANVSGPHAIGEIWCDMIWDLYWAMIDKYGDDGKLWGGDGGNSKAVELVFQGMKIQPCGVGFESGRDAILEADNLLFNGENNCLIWEVFARRGLGYFADGGSENSLGDNVVDFTPNLFCLDKVEMHKEVTKEVDKGGEINIDFNLKSYKLATAKNIKVTDVIPEHTSYVAGSGGTYSNGVVTFELDSLPSSAEHTFSYKIKVDDDYLSKLMYQEGFESEFSFPDGDWFNNIQSGNVFFEFLEGEGENGSNVYAIPALAGDYKTSFEKASPVTVAGAHPYLVLNHKYNTQGAVDGGNIRYSEDADSWKYFGDEVVRGKYPGYMAYASFTIPNLLGFSGDSKGWVHSFADLKALDTKELYFSLFYGASDGDATLDNWYIDNLELVDAVFVNSEACITVDGGSEECVEANELGTYVRHNGLVSTDKVAGQSIVSNVFPNPGNGSLNISWLNTPGQEMEITVSDASGRIVKQVKKQSSVNVNLINIDLSGASNGIYFVQLKNGKGIATHKYIKM